MTDIRISEDVAHSCLSKLRINLAARGITRMQRRRRFDAIGRQTDPTALLPDKWFYGNSDEFRTGLFERLPDITGKRVLEGGNRLSGISRRVEGPMVSIVTAVRNNPDTLQRCIDSVRAQGWHNVEHIIIDGGSDEPTLNVIKANSDNLAYFVSEPDGGIYSAMNKGIAVAQGDYICLLNSDDFYRPEFLESTISTAKKLGHPDIVYTDYLSGDRTLNSQEVNDGILFGHLHVCHNTFLTSKSCYDRIGPYREDLRIVSDAIWMRRAFLMKARFVRLPEPLFTLSDGGLSSGASEINRNLFIQEAAFSYRLVFPELEIDDAKEIYLFRFNKSRASTLLGIVRKHIRNPGICSALRGYVAHCLRDRPNFKLGPTDAVTCLPDILELVDALGVDLKFLQLETKQGRLSELLSKIDTVIAQRKSRARKTILHFVSVFSAPSETFIYDLVNRLEATSAYDNFVLFEHSKLRNERPFKKSIQVFWNDFPEVIAGQIYKYIVGNLRPDIVIAHFALNEWKWTQRTRDMGIEIPTISMCHGIDVFAMRDKSDYRDYLVEEFSKRSGTVFTAVSEYLRDELLTNGVPAGRVHLLHNTVSDRFFHHRKIAGFYDRDRELQLIAIGRLIPWKGHHILLDALARFMRQVTAKVRLTIVYGSGADQLDALRDKAQKLGILDHIVFVPFVNFNVEPGYLSQFDLFVQPSIYSEDKQKRSETFGVSVLEAIAAGLPVVVTDAGGLPEVVGDETRFARIVPHGDPVALADAIVQIWRDGTAFADNRIYAEERLTRFSAQAQMSRLEDLIEEVSKPRIRAALFSSSTIQGAGYAAFRVHRGLRETRVAPHMFTTVRNHEAEPDVTVIAHPSGDNNQWRRLQMPPRPGLTIFTVNDDHISTLDLLRMIEPYDVINLHWHARFLSLENIAALTRTGKPVVMTIRDMMPLTGGCHFFHGCDEWQRDCQRCPQLPDALSGYPASVLAMKRSNYDFSNLTLVTISYHTRQILEKVPVFNKCRIETIPNSIELDIFRPYDRNARRAEFDIPTNRKVIGYVPSYSSEIKGYREIVEALRLLDPASLGDEPYIMLIGPRTPATDAIPFEKKVLGYINDNHRLARAYSCADVIVVPSLEETFSNTTAEAIACGVPVVGFRTGAIPDLAVDGVSGFTCEVGDVAALAHGITTVLNGPSLKGKCRAHAESMLSFMTQARRYEALFEDLMGTSKNYPDLAATV